MSHQSKSDARCSICHWRRWDAVDQLGGQWRNHWREPHQEGGRATCWAASWSCQPHVHRGRAEGQIQFPGGSCKPDGGILWLMPKLPGSAFQMATLMQWEGSSTHWVWRRPVWQWCVASAWSWYPLSSPGWMGSRACRPSSFSWQACPAQS